MPAGIHLPTIEELPADFKTIMHNYHVTAANMRAGLDPNRGINDGPEYVEVYYQGDSAKLVQTRPCGPKKKVNYWSNACISLERAELLSKETTTHSLPRN